MDDFWGKPTRDRLAIKDDISFKEKYKQCHYCKNLITQSITDMPTGIIYCFDCLFEMKAKEKKEEAKNE
jgi:late competence protein required for DNA uptake (superfamily II DNA/RNA helicase)